VITTADLGWVLANWRPGSYDRSWAAEFADLGSRERIGEMALRTWDEHGQPRDELCLQMLRGEPIEPVTLGWDGGWWGGQQWRGRVWAGHHRIWIHHITGRRTIAADIVPPGERRPWPACHCAPAGGWAAGTPHLVDG
jgi:hypothetical protein